MHKKISKDTDLAAGFFTQTVTSDEPTIEATASADIVDNNKLIPNLSEERSEDLEAKASIKNVGGRPKKAGLKNEQFTLTMDPEMYEKLRLVADEYTRGNFSGLIDEAIRSFCRERGINLAEINVAPEILAIYQKKQEEKEEKRKKKKK